MLLLSIIAYILLTRWINDFDTLSVIVKQIFIHIVFASVCIQVWRPYP